MPEQKMHKYKIKNTANGPVHIKEMRWSVSSGKEREFVGVLTEGTKRLEEKGFISIKDLGAVKLEEIPKRVLSQNPAQRKAMQEDKERSLTKEVRENLEANKKKEEPPKATVEAVSASDMGVTEPPPIPEPDKEEPKKATPKKKKKSD